MKYYLHDTDAFNDEKISELFIEFGYEGLGLFYTILEKLAKQEKPIKTNVLKAQLKVGKKLNKCWDFMEQIDLISSNNGETFNKQLINFSEKYKIKSEKNAKRISEWREKQAVKENVTHYESVCNTPKVKESKVNKSKIKEEDNTESVSAFNFKKSLIDLGIEKELVESYLQIRKRKKLTNSSFSFDAIVREIKKTTLSPNDCILKAVEKGWGGFEAEWLNKQTNTQNDKTDRRFTPAVGEHTAAKSLAEM